MVVSKVGAESRSTLQPILKKRREEKRREEKDYSSR